MISIPDHLGEVLRGGGTLVLPSPQRAHAARLADAAAHLLAGQRVWSSPDILPLEAWLAREAEDRAVHEPALPRRLSGVEEWFLWRQCAAEAVSDAELLNRAALADGLRQSSNLALTFDIECANGCAGAGTETHLLHRVWSAVADRCRTLGAAPLLSLACRVDRTRAEKAHFAGFLTRPPLLRELGMSLGGAPTLATPHGVLAADEHDELELIATWCQRMLCERTAARLLVVLPGAPGARERLATLIRQALHPRAWLQIDADDAARTGGDDLVTIEGGQPLAQFPLIAHALVTLSVLAGEELDFNTVAEWLRSPYWQTPSAAARAHLELWLREHAPLRFDARAWDRLAGRAAGLAGGALRELLRQLRQAGDVLPAEPATARTWSEQFRLALGLCRWPGAPGLDSRDQQIVMRFHELLDEFGQLGAGAPRFATRAALHWLRELTARTAFRPGDEDPLVTISPVLADPVVVYDGIWIAGLHADAFPQPVRPDPFLPLPAQLASGVPSASAPARLREAQALIAAWRAAAGELVLSAPARAADLELAPSALLSAWLGDPKPAATRRTLKWLPLMLRREEQLELIEDPSGVRWPAGTPLPGTRALELQNLCAFRAYAELRLGSRELGVPEPGLAPDLRGRLLHLALQKLWDHLKHSRALAAQSPAGLRQLITRSVEEAAREVFPPTEDPSRVHASRPFADPQSSHRARELRRAVRLIGALCEIERRRSGFEVEATELETTLRIAGAPMRMRIDRLDRLEGGGRVILDYKSGLPVPIEWYERRPSHPQLLAYLAAIGADVIAMAAVHITARKIGYSGIARTPNLLPRVKGIQGAPGGDPGELWELQRRHWLECIEQLAGEFLAGRAAVDPKPGACAFCHVSSFCRISEGAADTEGAPEASADE